MGSVSVLLLVGLIQSANAAGTPLSGTRLLIREPPGRPARRDVVCRDSTLTLPTPGSSTDPSIVGISLVFDFPDGGSGIDAPGGVGWTVSQSPLTYRFKARQGNVPTYIRRALLREGRLVKVSVRTEEQALLFPHQPTSAFFRLNFGSYAAPPTGVYLCARWDAEEIVRNEPNVLLGGETDRPADCQYP